jgi:hypothetical protein
MTVPSMTIAPMTTLSICRRALVTADPDRVDVVGVVEEVVVDTGGCVVDNGNALFVSTLSDVIVEDGMGGKE